MCEGCGDDLLDHSLLTFVVSRGYSFMSREDKNMIETSWKLCNVATHRRERNELD